MKKNLLSFCILLIPIFLFSQDIKKVLIIGIDGVRSDAMQKANTPNLDNLIANGIFSPDALNDDITISGPGWSANLCGVWSDKHLVTGNNFSGNNYDDFPPIFKYVNDFNPDLHSVSICHWAPINDEIVQDYADFKLNVSSDLELRNQAVDYLSVNDPDLMFLHFDDVDHAGHATGFSKDNPEYISAIEVVDTQLTLILSSIEQRPNYANEDWLILVTTDHGGNGTSHGGNTFGEQNVFVIASGKNIDQAVIEKDSIVVFDNPINCLGDSVELNFDGKNDWVKVDANPIFDFGADQDFTIECRIRANVTGDFAIVGNKDWNSGNNKGFIFSYKYPSGPEWKVNIGDGSNRTDINTGGVIADNEWHTLSVSFNRDGMMRMYQDGEFIDEANISNIGDINTDEGLFFGADINGNYDYTGSIAEVRVWNTVVDASTIQTWNCTSIEDTHPNYDSLIGHWKINEGNSFTQIEDFSINDNFGNIESATWLTPDSVVTYIYDETPRITDIPVTALTHLCIPIDNTWELDGKSLIEVCETVGNENLISNFSTLEINLFPNPAKDFLKIEIPDYSFNDTIQIEIYHVEGKNILVKEIYNNTFTFNTSNLIPGIYYISFSNGKGKVTKQFVKS